MSSVVPDGIDEVSDEAGADDGNEHEGEDQFTDSLLLKQKPKKIGSCWNCTSKLRKHPCFQALSKRFYILFTATIIIQVLLFCVFLFDPKFGIFADPEDLPKYADCGKTESNFSPSVPMFAVSMILNSVQMLFDVCFIMTTILFVRQMKIKTVVLQYCLLSLVSSTHHNFSQFCNI